ncbi:hypothetical protein Tco_0619027, partial [Tanacetum coccineum]
MGHLRECRGPGNQDSRNRNQDSSRNQDFEVHNDKAMVYGRNINQDSSRRTINVEETSSKAMVAI